MVRAGMYVRMGYYDGLPSCMRVDRVIAGESVKLDHAPINGSDSWTYPNCTTGLSYTFGWNYASRMISSGQWQLISSDSFRELKILYENRDSDSSNRKAAYYKSLCESCTTPYTLQVL